MNLLKLKIIYTNLFAWLTTVLLEAVAFRQAGRQTDKQTEYSKSFNSVR